MVNKLICAPGTVMENGYGIIPKKVMQDPNLTIEAKAIYAYFASFAGSGETAFPSVNLIIKQLKISKDRYYRHFNKLVEQGYIRVRKQRAEGNKFDNNIYELLNVPCPYFEDTDFPYTENLETNINNNNINSKINNVNNGAFSDEKSTAQLLHNEEYIHLNPVLDYFYKKYKVYIGKEHSKLKISQLKRIYETLDIYALNLSDWKLVIDQYFATKLDCDYNLNHFASDSIIYHRGIEVGVIDPDYY